MQHKLKSSLKVTIAVSNNEFFSKTIGTINLEAFAAFMLQYLVTFHVNKKHFLNVRMQK